MLMIKRLMTRYIPGMLTCKEVDSFLYDFHEGNLSFAERFKFKLHLSMCRECRAYVRGYTDTVRFTKAGFTSTEPKEKIPEELIQAILQSRIKK